MRIFLLAYRSTQSVRFCRICVDLWPRHTRCVNYIWPDKPSNRIFEQTIQKPKKIPSDSPPLFDSARNLLYVKLTTWWIHAVIFDRESNRFELGTSREDQFGWLIFICEVQSPSHVDIRTRLLGKIEQQPNSTLGRVVEECKHWINLEHDFIMIRKLHRSNYNVNTIKVPNSFKSTKRPNTRQQFRSLKLSWAVQVLSCLKFQQIQPNREHNNMLLGHI